MQLFCAPTYPDKEPYGLAVILHYLDYSVTLTPDNPFDAAVLWEDKTFLEVPEVLQEIALSKPVINIGCTDISKQHVENTIYRLFGQTTFVDPTTYRGKCIFKPDGNAVRHGFVVDCPVEKIQQDWVYQRIIETRENGLQIEYRIPVILGEIPLVYVSQRDYPTSDIRQCKRHKLTPMPATEVLSPQEIQNMLCFSREIGMDMGELDVMRCKHDGQLYIIDANKTAAGYGLENRACWSPGDRKKVIAILAQVFEKNLKQRIREYERCLNQKAG
ncbi:hypothetical protein [Planctobacterium marinum]|uniref:ATP-grasp domain-containing protein n=1 Tax=Planctobacterium marinum TaxID=1631968 RepID=A0AA48HIN9_9ALTE|nr:hypothetical protein MACH26_09170 [Planctobacterium marinum]